MSAPRAMQPGLAKRIPSTSALRGLGKALNLRGLAALAALLVAAFALPSPSASAATLVVDPAGAIPDLPSALALAHPGDEIVLSPGAYAGGVTIAIDGVTLRGASADAPPTIAAPTGAPDLVIAAAGVSLQDVVVSGGAPGILADHAASLRLTRVASEGAETNGVEVRFSPDATLDGVAARGAAINGVRIASSPNATVSGSRFAGDGRGLHAYDDANLSLQRDVAEGNRGDGIVVESSPGARVTSLDVTGGRIGLWVLRSDAARIAWVNATSPAADGIVVESSRGASVERVAVVGAGVNGIRLRGADGASVSGFRVSSSLRGVHVENATGASLARGVVLGSSEHGVVLETDDAPTLSNLTIDGARRDLWVISTSQLSLADVAARNASEDLLNLTGSPGAVVARSTFYRSQDNGVRLLDSPGFALVDGAIADTRCDVFFEGAAAASATRSVLSSTNRPSALTTDLDPALLTVCDKPAQQVAQAGALGDHACDATEWHFVLNQLGDLPRPASVSVIWADGTASLAPFTTQTGQTAHYELAARLDATVAEASALAPASWGGNLELSGGPDACGGGGHGNG